MFETLISWKNLLSAYRKAAAGKRGRADVAGFEHRLEERLLELQDELQSGAYRPGGYRSFFIHEPKRRLISAAPFRDRVVHHALCHLIEPVFEGYVDDLLLFADDRSLLWRFKSELERRFERLRLTIHPGAHPRPVTEGIPFLGFVTFPDRRRLKRRKGIAFRRRLKRLRVLEATGELPAERVRASIAGWVGHVRYGNTVGLREAVLG